MNIELAEKVRALIRKYPERHDQNHWSSDSSLNPADEANCGTSACLAGWVVAATGRTMHDLLAEGKDVEFYSRDALEITNAQAVDLFYNFDNESALEYFDEMIAEAKAARDE